MICGRYFLRRFSAYFLRFLHPILIKTIIYASKKLTSYIKSQVINISRQVISLSHKQVKNRPVGQTATHSSLERDVRGSNLWLVKSETVLPTAGYRCNISLEKAVLPERNDAEMGLANSLHALAYYSEYNERFDFDKHQGCNYINFGKNQTQIIVQF